MAKLLVSVSQGMGGQSKGWPSPIGVVCLIACIACGADAKGVDQPAISKTNDHGSDLGAKPLVYVAVPPYAYFVEQIAGELVDTQVLINPGEDPHHYAPLPSEVKGLSVARIYVAAGLESEDHWREKFVSVNPEMQWVEASGYRSGQASQERKNGHTELDHATDHGWLALENIPEIITVLKDNLVALLPDAELQITANSLHFLSAVEQLADETRQTLSLLNGKSVLMGHGAWRNLLSEHGMFALVINPEGKTRSVRQIAMVISKSRELGIDTIIANTGHTAAGVEQVATAINASVVDVDPLAYDWLKNYRHLVMLISAAAR